MSVKNISTEITASQKPFVKQQVNTDFEVRSENAMCVNNSEMDKPLASMIKYAIAGILFGILLVKAEVV